MIIGFFSYFFNTLILFCFYNLIYLYKFYQSNFKLKKDFFIKLLITFLFFSFWSFLIINSDTESNFTSIVNKKSPNDFKTILICLFFIGINFTNLKINTNQKSKIISKYLVLFQICFISCYYSNLITDISLGGEITFIISKIKAIGYQF